MRKLILAGLIGFISLPAEAHDWYPRECCGGWDCAPAERVVSTSGGLWVTTKHGTAFFDAAFATRESKDGRIHACMRPEGGGKFTPLCLFIPPQS